MVEGDEMEWDGMMSVEELEMDCLLLSRKRHL